jgi:hypothetical protein
VAPAAAALAGLDRLDFPLPGPGRPGKDVLALLDEAASPATVASGGPRYFGFVIGGALPAAQAAAWLTAAWDQNAALTVMSPAAARLDTVALRWVTELLGLPPGTGGGFVTGASMANATCLAAARDAVLSRHGWDAAGQGLVGAPPVTVLVGEQVHTTVRKALGLTGLGRDRAIVLPTDSQGPHRAPLPPHTQRRPGAGLPSTRSWWTSARTGPRRWWLRCSETGLAGAGRPAGRAARPCGSASAPGTPPRPTSTAAWPPYWAAPAGTDRFYPAGATRPPCPGSRPG